MVLPQVETQFQGNIPLVREYRKIFPHQGEGSGKNQRVSSHSARDGDSSGAWHRQIFPFCRDSRNLNTKLRERLNGCWFQKTYFQNGEGLTARNTQTGHLVIAPKIHEVRSRFYSYKGKRTNGTKILIIEIK